MLRQSGVSDGVVMLESPEAGLYFHFAGKCFTALGNPHLDAECMGRYDEWLIRD